MRVRAATDADYEAFTAFWRELGLEHPPPPRERWCEHLRPSTIFLADDSGELAAYALVFPLGERGDVRQIVVGPSYRRRGVGRELMATIAARFRAAGCVDWRLEVRADNAPAIALYRSVGMTAICDAYTMLITRPNLDRFAATRTGDHVVTPLDPSDDALLEAHFDLGRGEIARWRRVRAGSPFGRVGTTALTHVWRDFMPDRALLFPLDAPDANIAAHLAAFALTSTDRPAFEVYVTSPVIHAALLAAGAEPHEHQLEMGGPLPSA